MPKPVLNITAPTMPLFEGMTVDLVCSVVFPLVVDIDVNVTITWLRGDEVVLNFTDFVNTSRYESRLNIPQINQSAYTCAVRVGPAFNVPVLDTSVNETIKLNVEGDLFIVFNPYELLSNHLCRCKSSTKRLG